jgi:hypothetical protein
MSNLVSNTVAQDNEKKHKAGRGDDE